MTNKGRGRNATRDKEVAEGKKVPSVRKSQEGEASREEETGRGHNQTNTVGENETCLYTAACVDRVLPRFAQRRAAKLSASMRQQSTAQAVDSSTRTLVHHVENEALGT
ncbi:hypothetical protein B0T13DRAFT_445573 [Neurospora crassa]|nr:hypothetical protein B0T13DRAFT_445573 [Neurospora crassa]